MVTHSWKPSVPAAAAAGCFAGNELPPKTRAAPAAASQPCMSGCERSMLTPLKTPTARAKLANVLCVTRRVTCASSNGIATLASNRFSVSTCVLEKARMSGVRLRRCMLFFS